MFVSPFKQPCQANILKAQFEPLWPPESFAVFRISQDEMIPQVKTVRMVFSDFSSMHGCQIGEIYTNSDAFHFSYCKGINTIFILGWSVKGRIRYICIQINDNSYQYFYCKTINIILISILEALSAGKIRYIYLQFKQINSDPLHLFLLWCC